MANVELIHPSYDRLYEETDVKGLTIAPDYGTATNRSITSVQLSILPPNENIFIKQAVPSIADYWKSLGYKTEYMHVVGDKFYNFKANINHLGYDELYLGSHFNTIWGDDVQLFNLVIKNIAQAIENDEKLMIFMVDFSKHSPYDGSHLAHTENNSSAFLKYFWQTDQIDYAAYLDKSVYSDQYLDKLSSFIREQNKEVIMLIAGDHQPGLLRNKERDDKYKTDFLIWSNKRRLKANDTRNEYYLFQMHSLLVDVLALPKRMADKFLLDIKPETINYNNIYTIYIDMLEGSQTMSSLFSLKNPSS